MARLLSYYRLCPLIDTKNLLGISEDTEKGIVIVTLGRNMAIKFRLSDQKQLCSWRTKEKFSSPVVYDKKLEKYVAVFNQTFLRIWDEEEETLDKVKKYKFNEMIETILTHNNQTFVLFKTGSVYSLSEVLENRKTFSPAAIIEKGEIHNVTFTSLEEDLYLGILVKNGDWFDFFWTIHTNNSKNIFSKIKLFMENVSLRGSALFSTKENVSLLTVWSDGKIYAKELVRHDKDQSNIGELFTVLENISTQHCVKIVPLDEKYISIYGSDPNEEGAVLLIYNTQFKVTQSKQIHKLYTDDAEIWKSYNFILLPVGQNLIVVPFCLESEQLVALIGSHKPVPAKIDSDIAFVTEFEVAHWDDSYKDVSKKKKKHKQVEVDIKKRKEPPNGLKDRFDEFFKEGLAEAVIIEQIIPEVLEENNVKLLKDCIKFFTDISEKFIAKILQFTLSCDRKEFPKISDLNYNNLPEKLLPNARVRLLDKILTLHFSDTLLLPHLRNELGIDQATFLLQYLEYQLSEDGHNLPLLTAVKTEKCIIHWISLVIDANYQKFVLSKDNNIHDILVKCQNSVLGYLQVLEDMKTVVPVLDRFAAEANGKFYASGSLANSLYSIEQVDF